MKTTEQDLALLISAANAVIEEQNKYIEELEQKVDDLQEALEALLLNKCRTRKVKVKYIGRL